MPRRGHGLGDGESEHCCGGLREAHADVEHSVAWPCPRRPLGAGGSGAALSWGQVTFQREGAFERVPPLKHRGGGWLPRTAHQPSRQRFVILCCVPCRTRRKNSGTTRKGPVVSARPGQEPRPLVWALRPSAAPVSVSSSVCTLPGAPLDLGLLSLLLFRSALSSQEERGLKSPGRDTLKTAWLPALAACALSCEPQK